MNPLISIIVPVYKVEQYLDECVQSIRNQTYTNLEIILVDDGSPDRCPEMCDEYARQDSRIKVIHKPNGGLSSARNAGLEVMNGEYFGFVDSDDYIDKHMYETLISYIDQTARISACCAYKVLKDGREEYYSPYCNSIEYYSGEAFLKSVYPQVNQVEVWLRLFSTKDFGHLRFREHRIAEDLLYMSFIGLEMEKNRSSMVRLPYFGYYYRYVETSITHSKKDLIKIDATRNIKEFCANENLKELKIYKRIFQIYLGHLVLIKAKAIENSEYLQIFQQEFAEDFYKNSYKKEYNWGIRHIFYYYIVRYFPFLYNIPFVKHFCTKTGSIASSKKYM